MKKVLKKNFDVQSIEIDANYNEVFDFVAKPENLPLWTKAFSRITENGVNSIYSFVLLAPPVPLEQLEGTLSIQKKLLAEELIKLKESLEVR